VKEYRVEFTRGGRTESVHLVRAAAVLGRKRLLARGDVAEPVFMRSSAKPFQALAVVESGAADSFGFSDEEFAVTCGSHGADDVHVAAVESILRKSGVKPDALRCGVHPPLSPKALKALYAAGKEPTALHNNCSGKHAGMLAAAKRLGAPLGTYLSKSHPVQRRNLANVKRWSGLARVGLGVDGCSAPNFALPLDAMARMASALASEGGGLGRIRAAMTAHPVMVGRPCVNVMSAAPGRIVSKGGAEGVYLAGFPDSGVGVALKALDGASRPLLHVLLAVVGKLRLLDAADRKALAKVADPVLRNHAGLAVGQVLMK
jgi:L-asparaginase II